MFKFLAMFALCIAIAVAAPPNEEHDPAPVNLSFGLYASANPSLLYQQFRPVLDDLERHIENESGRKIHIRLVLTRTYADGVAAIVNGDVDFTRTGPASYLDAYTKNPDIHIIGIEQVDGSSTFSGIIAVRENSEITDVTDLAGKSFAFGSEDSTIGRWLSQLFLANNDIHADDLSSYAYLGRHDAVGRAVARGEFAAGALHENMFNHLVASGYPLRELARFPNTTKPWFVSSKLDHEIIDMLHNGLMAIDDRLALRLLEIDGFVPGDHSDYTDIEAAIYQNHLFFE